jgi:peroxiredoxin
VKKRIAAIALVALALAGCTSGPGVSSDYTAGGDGDYVSGDGATRFYAEDSRADPVQFAGPTVDGGTLGSDDLAGKVALVNFWYADCGPCRTEADDLTGLFDEFGERDVAFVGINIRDTAARASSFEVDFEVDYPSILDVEDNAVTLAFAQPNPPTTTPTTYLLDKQGRVAARFTSAIDDRVSVISTMIDDLLAEE